MSQAIVREGQAASPPVSYETHPDRYRHWRLSFDGPIATLSMGVDEDGGIRDGYKLKLIGGVWTDGDLTFRNADWPVINGPIAPRDSRLLRS